MPDFELRGKTVRVQKAQLYESSAWNAMALGELMVDETLTIRAVILATHDESSRRQEPYAYID